MATSTGAPKVEPQAFEADQRTSEERPAAGIAIAGLAHSFGSLAAIERIDLEVAPGDVVALVGPSGCGKTTLLEIVSGLRAAGSGAVRVGDAGEAEGRLRRTVYMPQRDMLLPWLSAIDNAALGLRLRGAGRAEARAAVAADFARLGLAGFEDARPARLSGGMRQRVAFLRTLAAGKPVLALDEPFASLDAITRAEMQGWLAAALAADRRTVLLVTHDVEEALYLGDRVLVLSARPARVVDEIAPPSPRAADRAAAVTAPAFAALRERALRELEGGSR